MAAATAYMLFWSEKSWAESSKRATTGLIIKKTVAEERGQPEGDFLLFHDTGVHRFQDAVSALEGRSSHEVYQTSMTTLKCLKDLTTASSEERKEEGTVEASSEITEAKNLDPHILRERKAIAVWRSFS